jgi:hypothetical protein
MIHYEKQTDSWIHELSAKNGSGAPHFKDDARHALCSLPGMDYS